MLARGVGKFYITYRFMYSYFATHFFLHRHYFLETEQIFLGKYHTIRNKIDKCSNIFVGSFRCRNILHLPNCRDNRYGLHPHKVLI